MVQIVPGHPAEAERVEVAEGDGREGHHGRCDLIQLGDVWVLQVEVNTVGTHQHQERERADEEDNPKTASHTQTLVREHVRDAVERGPAGEDLHRHRALDVQVLILSLCFKIHDGQPLLSLERQRLQNVKLSKFSLTSLHKFSES